MSAYNSGHKWDARSLAQKLTLTVDLRTVMEDALRMSDVPFQLVQGARTIEQQRAYFQAGKSKIDPDAPQYRDRAALYRDAKHVVGPGAGLARAVDIIIQGPNPYDVPHLCHVAGVVMTAARVRGIKIRWGGNFNRDAQILEQAFDDLPHFEVE